MFYFCKRPFYSTHVDELKQFGKVVKFRRALERLGVLYWEYDSPLEFERRLREHLIRQILDVRTLAKKAITKAGTKSISAKRVRYPSTKSVFFSYVHSDKSRVREIATDLKIAGLNVWLDEDELLPGQDWLQKIEEAIKQSDAMLVFVSKNTKERPGSFYQELKIIHRNLRLARNRKPRLIPVRLDPVVPPFDLKNYMWVDVFSKEQIPSLVEAIYMK